MKRTGIVAAVAATALAAAGIAVAHGVDGGKSIRTLSGTFTATSASHVSTRTCTTSDGKTVVTSDGIYTGTAGGDPDLTGPVTLRAHSTINTTDGAGYLTGTLRVDVASGRDTTASLTGVYSGGTVAGIALGHARTPWSDLVANVSAGFSPTAGFTSGKIGGGSAGGAAVEIAPAGCRAVTTVKEHSQARGIVTAVSSTSITVAGLTCAVPASLQAKVAQLSVNAIAEIRCGLVNGTNTLTSISKRR